MPRRLADRYHLVQNLREHLQQFLDRKCTWLPEVEDTPLNEGSLPICVNAGEHTGSHLFREIKERGYTGSESGLRHVLGEWRTELPPKPRQGPPRKQRLAPKPKKRRLSSRGAAFLMILPPSKLTEIQQRQIAQMNQNEDLRSVYLLSQEFVTMLKERQVQALDCWLKRAKACQRNKRSRKRRKRFFRGRMKP